MRLKTYSAATVGEAMALVRRELGTDAIIVSTLKGEDGNGARIVAALEDRPEDDVPASVPDEAPLDAAQTVRQALAYHGTPRRLAERLAAAAAEIGGDDPVLALAGALDHEFVFHPLERDARALPLMLVGPPGAGKTIVAAKLAARAVLAGRPPNLISTDCKRAGAIGQLAAFARILKLELRPAETIASLIDAVAAGGPEFAVQIDTAGANPFDDDEMAGLQALIAAARAEPVLVLAAGGDAMDSAEVAAAFAQLGCRRMVVTRLDAARRLGSVLAAADAGDLAFAEVSVAPQVASGLALINPMSLARLMLPHAERAAPSQADAAARPSHAPSPEAAP